MLDDVIVTLILLSRDALKLLGYVLIKDIRYEQAVTQILNIQTEPELEVNQVYINPDVLVSGQLTFKEIFMELYSIPERSKEPKHYAVITVK